MLAFFVIDRICGSEIVKTKSMVCVLWDLVVKISWCHMLTLAPKGLTAFALRMVFQQFLNWMHHYLFICSFKHYLFHVCAQVVSSSWLMICSHSAATFSCVSMLSTGTVGFIDQWLLKMSCKLSRSAEEITKIRGSEKKGIEWHYKRTKGCFMWSQATINYNQTSGSHGIITIQLPSKQEKKWITITKNLK